MRDLLDYVFGPSASSVGRSPADDFWYRPVLMPTQAGVDVNEDVALTHQTVYACVNKLAKSIATLPVHVYERLPNGNDRRAPEHWLQRLWQKAPNPEMSAASAREAFMANTLLWGNGVMEIQRTRGGQPAYLWPLLTRFLTLKRDDNDTLYFEYNVPGEATRILSFDQVVNLAAFSTDGIVGRTPIQVARESVGLGLAARQFQSSFLKKGASPSVVLKHPGEVGTELSEPAAKRLINSFNEQHQGSANAGNAILLEEGTDITVIGMSLKDAQYLELGHALKEDICGMYDVPLSMIQDDKRATYANNEQKAIDWVVGSLLPWCVKIEAVVDNTLLNGGRRYFLKHELDGLMRGDTATRAEYYTKMIRVGMTQNEIRRLENLNGIGPEGDRSYISADLVPVDMIDEVLLAKRTPTGSPPSEPKEPGDREDAALVADVTHTKESVALLHQGVSVIHEGLGTFLNIINEGVAADEARHDELTGGVERIQESVEAGVANNEKQLSDARAEGKAASESHDEKIDAAADKLCGEMRGGFADATKIITEDFSEKLAVREATAEAFRPMLLDVTQRLVTKEIKAVGAAWQRHAKKGTVGTFSEWAEKFYAEHEDAARKAALPALESCCTLLKHPDKCPYFHAEGQARLFASQYASVSLAAVRDCIGEAPGRLPEELNKWQQSKAEELAEGLLAKITDRE